MINSIKRYWEQKPLLLILIIGALIRLISAIFSKGFGMQDDHFLVIEAAQSWIDDSINCGWLPVSGNNITPPGHSFLYPGLHYLFFYFMKWINLTDPQTKMFFIRFFHAAYSLLVVYFGFKITEKLSNKKIASLAGLLLAVYWFMPFYSVRNLVEMVCIPLLMWGTWLILITNYELRITNKKAKDLLLAGLILGIAFSIRYQTLVFTGGLALVMLMQKKWKEPFFMLTGVLLSIVLFEGGIDYFVWGYPFAELIQYVIYNLDNAYNYITLPWYHYIVYLLGMLLPPVSLFLFFGYFYAVYLIGKSKDISYSKLLIFLPSFLFLLFHSLFPNKQDRFILSIIPFIIILGIIGWNDFIHKHSAFSIKYSAFIKGCWIFFWIINLMLLTLLSSSYSKKARVESMVYLSKYKNINCILQEGSTKLAPRFYLNQWLYIYDITDKNSFETIKNDFLTKDKKDIPEFVLFYDNKDLDNRVNAIRTFIPNLKYETTIEPGLLDKILYRLNHKNSNQTIIIYKNTYIR